MPNLIKLYTRNGAIWVDTDELSKRGNLPQGRCLCVYTSRGNRLCDTSAWNKASPMTRPSDIVHPSNIFATPELAKDDMDRIHTDMASRWKS